MTQTQRPTRAEINTRLRDAIHAQIPQHILSLIVTPPGAAWKPLERFEFTRKCWRGATRSNYSRLADKIDAVEKMLEVPLPER